jgi:energy-coupling factor transport system substrate-specific component
MSGATTVILIGVALAALGLVAMERGPAAGRELALVAVVSAVAVAGRVLFAPIPSVKPVTMICVVTGATLGLRAGMAVGAIAALVSNAFLGQGPWTPPQMALWAAAGATGALLRVVVRRRIGLAAVTFVWGYLFGWAMNLWFLAVFGPDVSWDAFATASAGSLWFDTAHAIGNVVFSLAAGAALIRLLDRYATRIRVRIEWEQHPPPAPSSPAPTEVS